MMLKNFYAQCNTFLLLLLVIAQHATAFHIVGGEISYECLGDNTYQISMSIYRDCYCVNCADFDMPANIAVMDNNGNVVQQLQAFDLVVTPLEIATEGLCLETAPDVCVEQGFYSLTATLPPIAGGYQILYQRCCRNSTIVNIIDPSGTGSTYTVDIPESDTDCNSSPFFVNYPPIVICANSPLVFDHSAIDYDGDSLVYAICEPYEGASSGDPAPILPYPYNNVTWNTPYSATNQLGGSPPMNIDPQTGLLTAFPTTIGQFVVGICVSEYRNGELLGTKIRDFQFNVADCDIVLAQAAAEGGGTICLGESVQLEGEIFGGTDFSWTPTTGLSNANTLNPIATPTQTTNYVLSVTNNATGCSDTDTIQVTVVQPIELNVGDDASFCVGAFVQLNPTGNANLSYQWSPTIGLNNATVPNPVANPTQTTTYTVIATDATGSCSGSDQVTITVGQLPLVSAGEDVVSCAGGNVQLDGTGSSNAGNFQWIPATSLDNANSPTPIASPTQPTTYTLIVTDPTGTCTAIDEVSVIVGNNSNPGTMPTALQYLCAGESSNAATIGAQLEGNDVLAYILHTNPTAVIGTVLATNTNTGSFALSDNPALQTNTVYYIAAIVGPEGATANVPDFEHPCTVTNVGMPVVFLKPVSFLVNEDCDWSVGDYTVTVFPQGGLPEFEATATYTISGASLNSTLVYGQSESILFTSSQTPNSYDFTATDGLGCVGSVANSFPVCLKTPIELLHFEGKVQDNGHLLTWTTASETNNHYFILERSVDGVRFAKIAQINAVGNSFSEQNYSHIDTNVPAGTVYYRLSQTDIDNHTQVLKTIVMTHKNAGTLTVLPIPATNDLWVNFVAQHQQVLITLFDMTGKRVEQQSYTTVVQQPQQIKIAVAHLPAGVYWLHLQEGTHWHSLKWVKE